MRPISCNQEMGTQKGMCAQEAHSLSQSHALFHSLPQNFQDKSYHSYYYYLGCSLVTKLCPTLLQPHGLQPSVPWDFPDKNNGVGAIFFSRGYSQPTCGISPVSPAMIDRFFTPEPPGKPSYLCRPSIISCSTDSDPCRALCNFLKHSLCFETLQQVILHVFLFWEIPFTLLLFSLQTWLFSKDTAFLYHSGECFIMPLLYLLAQKWEELLPLFLHNIQGFSLIAL